MAGSLDERIHKCQKMKLKGLNEQMKVEVSIFSKEMLLDRRVVVWPTTTLFNREEHEKFYWPEHHRMYRIFRGTGDLRLSIRPMIGRVRRRLFLRKEIFTI
jgi:hypothetical protein